MSSTVGADIVDRAERQAAAKVRTRRLLVRIHMWIALGLGLYIVVLSVSGSAVVFRRELTNGSCRAPSLRRKACG